MIGWYRRRLLNSIEYDIGEWLYNEHESVEVKSAQGMFNLKCFENAVQYAITHEGCSVVMGIVIEPNDKTNLHFWNVDAKGNHLETTLGYRAEVLVYYPLRTIPERNYQAIGCVFDDALNYFTNKHTTKWQRFVLGGERIL